MDLSRIGIVARERTSWEALDLGIVLARKWYRPLLLGWIIPSALVFILFTILFFDNLWVGVTLTWWLKPVWDRIPLHIASRALFGEEVSVKSALKSLPKLAWTDLIPWLTWRRLSFTRSFDMPITVLENLKGKARQQRLQVLHIESGSAAAWLTIVCVHLEAALLIGGLGLIYMFIPAEVDFDVLNYIETQQKLAELLYNSVYYVAMVLVAPFYTIAGFALYISRRISLEGWDIEIRFRHLADRQSRHSFEPKASLGDSNSGVGTKPGTGAETSPETNAEVSPTTTPATTPATTSTTTTSSKTEGDDGPGSGSGVTLGLLLAFILPLTLFHSPNSQAANSDIVSKPVLSTEAKAARDNVAEVLRGKDFNQTITKKSWRFKDTEDLQDDSEFPQWIIDFIEYLEENWPESDGEEGASVNIGVILAKILEFVLWIVAISVVLFILYHYRDYLKSFATSMKFSKKQPIEAPEVLFGLDVRKESLPENIPQQVLSLWQNGSHRDALGLLYRATLSRLIHQYQFNFSESDTEKECAEIVQRSEFSEVDSYMQRLTRIWQRLAYGHRMPEESDVTSLCQIWPEIFSHES